MPLGQDSAVTNPFAHRDHRLCTIPLLAHLEKLVDGTKILLHNVTCERLVMYVLIFKLLYLLLDTGVCC